MTQHAAPRFLNPATPPHIVTLTLMTGIAALSMNVFLPALPEMAKAFGVEYRVIQLTVPIYLAMNALLQIVLGPVSDRIGRRPVLLASFAMYSVATLGCVFAPNIAVFFAFRMLQAFVVTGMVLSRAVVRDMVEGDKAAAMIAYITMGMSLVPMFAPTIGGFLAQHFGWQATFWLQVVLGAGILALMYRDLGETKARSGETFRDQLAAYPELLTSPRFWGYSLSAMFASGAFFAYLGGGPFVGGTIFGLDSGTLGLYLGAPAFGYLVGNFLTSRYAVKLGINRLIQMGSILTALGLLVSLVLTLTDHSNAQIFFGLMSTVGLGNGLVLPNANAGMLGVRPKLAGSASGLGGAMMIGGGAVIAATVGAMLTVESGPAPLLWMMLISTVLAIVAIRVVIRRERQLGLTG